MVLCWYDYLFYLFGLLVLFNLSSCTLAVDMFVVVVSVDGGGFFPLFFFMLIAVHGLRLVFLVFSLSK